MWRFMKENEKCQPESNDISDDLKCTICKKVLINPHYGTCGCRFCLDCITAYLDGQQKCCPGNKDDCKEELMDIDENVYFDPVVNRIISRLSVKCPRQFCEFRCQWRKMEKHVRSCVDPVKCPYFSLGCKEAQLANDRLCEHLSDFNELHCKLMVSAVDRLHTEIGSLKRDMIELRSKEGRQKFTEEQARVMEYLNEEMRLMKLNLEEERVNKPLTRIQYDLVNKIRDGMMDQITKEIAKLQDEKQGIQNGQFREIECIKEMIHSMRTEIEEEQRLGIERSGTMDEIREEMEILRDQEEKIKEKHHSAISGINESLCKLRAKLDEETRKTEANNIVEEMAILRNENQIMKERIDKYQTEYRGLARANEQQLSDIRTQVHTETAFLKLSAEKYKTDYSALVASTNQMLADMRKQNHQLKEEMANVRNENQTVKAKHDSLKVEINKNRTEYLGQARATEQQLSEMRTQTQSQVRETKMVDEKYQAQYSTLVASTNQKLAEMRTQAQTQVAEINQLKQRLDDFENVNDYDDSELNFRADEYDIGVPELNHFEWCLSHWSFHRDSLFQIFSDSFYTHKFGYKMCLSLTPNSWGPGQFTHLGVSFHLMKGPYDHYLSWPFKREVTISLINQHTGVAHSSFIAQFDGKPRRTYRNKPNGHRNKGIGDPHFINRNVLDNNKKLFRNDQLIIHCRVK